MKKILSVLFLIGLFGCMPAAQDDNTLTSSHARCLANCANDHVDADNASEAMTECMTGCHPDQVTEGELAAGLGQCPKCDGICISTMLIPFVGPAAGAACYAACTC